MQYLTSTHTAPPAHILADGKRWPVATLIARNDTARLADLGIYPHITAEGTAPLGYTDWVLIDGAYHREPAGTPEERQAAIDAQQASEREAYFD